MPLPPHPLAALLSVAARLDRTGVEWLLAGSAARALLGLVVRPADVDVEISPHGARVASEALGIALAYESGDGRSSWRGRGRVGDVEVDVTTDLEVEGPGGRLTPDFALQRTWAHSTEVGGRRIWLAPTEEAFARAVVLGDWLALARVCRQAGEAHDAPALRPAYLSLRLSSAAASAAR